MSTTRPSPEEILALLADVGKPLHIGAIAKRLRYPESQFDAALQCAEKLVETGQLLRAGRHRYRRGAERAHSSRRAHQQHRGLLSVTGRGFGFVAAAGKPDVYVPASSMAGAMHGDTVEVEVVKQTPRGAEGAIVQVVTRARTRVAGVLRTRRNVAWLEPDDDRIRGPIVLAKVPAADDGIAIVAELTRYPEHPGENPEGRVIAILGPEGDAEVEVQKIKVREQIEEAHPSEAMAEAEAIALRARQLSAEGREDLRGVPFLTIDPADARDHDDAVYAEKTPDGFRAYVAIADVAEYVQPSSALDEEAKRRGCTIYLPDRAIPMLPGALAADLCSLLPERERYCLCAIVDLDAQGTVKKARVVEGLMRAAALITYDSAARTLGFTDQPPLSPQAEAFKKPLKVIASLTQKLRRARMSRGALNLDLPEAKVQLAPGTHEPTGITQRAVDPGIKKGYQLVEELMLLANEVVAQWLIARKSPAVYRVHGAPDEEKLLRLVTAAETLGLRVSRDDLGDSKKLSRFLRRIAKHPKKPILEMLLLRSLKQASYDIVNIGHFGLASDAYVHFTSPIRRYPDLLVHRAVKRLIRGQRAERSADALEALAEAATLASARERAAIKVEREVVDLYRALYMRDHIGEHFEATVTAFSGSGLFAAVTNPFVDIMVRFEALGKERFELADDQLSLVAERSGERISLGDTLIIRVEDVSVLRRQVYGTRLAYSLGAPSPSDSHGRPARPIVAKSGGRTQQGTPKARDRKPSTRRGDEPSERRGAKPGTAKVARPQSSSRTGAKKSGRKKPSAAAEQPGARRATTRRKRK